MLSDWVKQLYCFPHAGSGAGYFRAWQRLAEGELEICPIAYPGRERRVREPLAESMSGLVDGLVAEILPRSQGTRWFYGHSMGGVVAFEVALRLQAEGHKLEGLVVGGSAAPQLRTPPVGLSELPRAEFVEEIGRRYGGLPAAVRDQPGLLDVFVPVLRADLRMMERYVYSTGELDCPILVLGGLDDRTVSQQQLGGWAHLTRGPAEVVVLPGGHFFHQTDTPAVVERVIQFVSRAASES